jgi:uncharacterized coiled-coil protein SlyX
MAKLIIIIILAVCLAGALAWGIITQGKISELEMLLANRDQVINDIEQTVIDQFKLIGASEADVRQQMPTIDNQIEGLGKFLVNAGEAIEAQNERYDELWEDYQSLQSENDELQTEVAEWQQAYQQKPSVSTGLREFRSEQELADWLTVDQTNENKYISNQFDCEDFARMLQGNAFSDGYIISITLTGQDSTLHVMNCCLIGNKVYWIEPQTDEFSFWSYTD